MRKRIDHSCMQLHFTELKLDQVARMAGFCDRYHFSRTFKRLRGIGPAAFRKQSINSR
jgi:AraC-like DNA-binding protein